MPRPYYCEAPDEEKFPDLPCPACGATVSGNDPVRGVCQSLRGPRPQPLLQFVLIDKATEQVVASATVLNA